jgi:probable rRNA maturation factor
MLNLEYYNDTKTAISGLIFEELLDAVNNNAEKIFPKSLDNRKNYSVTLTLVNNKLIQKINKKYRGVDAPTDVVSLSYLNQDFPGQDVIGEIFISIEKAQKQADEIGHDLLTEIKFLFIHGVLHCIGYEHSTEEDFETMMSLTNQILKSF